MVIPLVQKAVPSAVSLLRTPLLVADTVAARLGVGSAVHPKVQQGLAALDAVADRVAPAAAPAAPATPSSGEVPDDKEEVVQHLAEELLEEEEYAPMAGELADDDELRRVQAELNAKRLVAEQEEQHPD